jgi:hypothetical protein
MGGSGMLRPTKDAAVLVERAPSRRTNNARSGPDVASPRTRSTTGMLLGGNRSFRPAPLFNRSTVPCHDALDIRKGKAAEAFHGFVALFFGLEIIPTLFCLASRCCCRLAVGWGGQSSLAAASEKPRNDSFLYNRL